MSATRINAAARQATKEEAEALGVDKFIIDLARKKSWYCHQEAQEDRIRWIKEAQKEREEAEEFLDGWMAKVKAKANVASKPFLRRF